MRTKPVFAGIALTFLIPFTASASTISDLQSQVAQLLAQIQALQDGASTTVSAPVGINPTAGPVTACPVLNRSLSTGSRGNDVMALQEFLETQGYLNISATGYFGTLTRSAVGKWQVDNGVATSNSVGFGRFGPMSRSAFVRICGGSQNRQPFSANPQSGAAPLSVTFTTGDSIVSSSTYSVNFGDGTNAAMVKGECVGITAIVGGQGGIRCSYTVSHTYSANGTYTATLLKQTPFACPGNAMCVYPQIPVATATITVNAIGTTTPNDQRMNAPGVVMLQQGGIAEIRNENAYFTLTNLTASTATIQVTPVGCWNSFPSDTPPAIRCMIAVVLIAPQTLSVGQSYTNANYTITLQQINGTNATFSVTANATSGY